MQVQLRFFASVRERVGTSHEMLEVPEHIVTVGEVRNLLLQRGGAWEAALNETRALRMACNQEMTGPATIISDGCEIAFFPPVTGG